MRSIKMNNVINVAAIFFLLALLMASLSPATDGLLSSSLDSPSLDLQGKVWLYGIEGGGMALGIDRFGERGETDGVLDDFFLLFESSTAQRALLQNATIDLGKGEVHFNKERGFLVARSWERSFLAALTIEPADGDPGPLTERLIDEAAIAGIDSTSVLAALDGDARAPVLVLTSSHGLARYGVAQWQEARAAAPAMALRQIAPVIYADSLALREGEGPGADEEHQLPPDDDGSGSGPNCDAGGYFATSCSVGCNGGCSIACPPPSIACCKCREGNRPPRCYCRFYS